MIRNLKNNDDSKILCKGVFIAIGHVPNTKPFEGVLPLDTNGYLIPEKGIPS